VLTYLKELLKKLQKGNSLFTNHKLNDILKKRFKAELKAKILNRRKPEYYDYVEHFFVHDKFNEALFWEKTLDNHILPFKTLNNWFGKFVDAVDAGLENRTDQETCWKKADDAYMHVPAKIRLKYKLEERPVPKNWFAPYKDGKYCFTVKFKKEGLWNSYKNRQGEEKGSRYFFNYRHAAFLRLLNELAI